MALSFSNTVPFSGCLRPRSLMNAENNSLSSARSMTLAVVPEIFAPIAVSFLANFNGV